MSKKAIHDADGNTLTVGDTVTVVYKTTDWVQGTISAFDQSGSAAPVAVSLGDGRTRYVKPTQLRLGVHAQPQPERVPKPEWLDYDGTRLEFGDRVTLVDASDYKTRSLWYDGKRHGTVVGFARINLHVLFDGHERARTVPAEAMRRGDHEVPSAFAKAMRAEEDANDDNLARFLTTAIERSVISQDTADRLTALRAELRSEKEGFEPKRTQFSGFAQWERSADRSPLYTAETEFLDALGILRRFDAYIAYADPEDRQYQRLLFRVRVLDRQAKQQATIACENLPESAGIPTLEQAQRLADGLAAQLLWRKASCED